MPKIDVFISYAREDREQAALFAKALISRGWSVWWDHHIIPGHAFDVTIEEQLAIAKSVVVLWSKQSIASEWVRNEASSATERGVMIPVLIEKVRMPIEFRRKQAADLVGWDGDHSNPGFQAVCDAVAAFAALQSNTTPTSSPIPTSIGGLSQLQPLTGIANRFNGYLEELTSFCKKYLSWRVCFVIAVCFLLVDLMLVYANSFSDALSKSLNFYKVITAAPGQIPLSPSVRTQACATKKNLTRALQASIDSPENVDPSPWALAQAIVATNGLLNFDRATLETTLRKMSGPECSGWKELGHLPCNIAVSGWVIFALAELETSATNDELKFLLDEQNPKGWWSLFPDANQPEYASSYATAWAVLALQAQLTKGLASETLSKSMAAAIKRGHFWLLSQVTEKSRWKDYPYLPDGQQSDSISGLVTHVLHMTGRQLTFEEDWLEALPRDFPTAEEYTQGRYTMEPKTGSTFKRLQDHILHYKLPWLLIATADAYPAGSTLQRIHALAWLESALSQKTVIAAYTGEKTRGKEWWHAELLIAIRTVLDKSGIDCL